ncbi:MAG: NADPH-dependent oxidoreductase, partial [Pseudomonadota bacterium]
MTFLIFIGSERQSAPPHPARLGERVAKACARRLAAHDAPHAFVDP